VTGTDGYQCPYGFRPQFGGISPIIAAKLLCVPAQHVIVGLIPLGVGLRSLVVFVVVYLGERNPTG
jgi:hypothetical protein